MKPRNPTPLETLRTERALQYIVQYKRGHGYAPNIREINRAIDAGSTSYTRRILSILRDAGKITWRHDTARAIDVVGARWLATDDEVLKAAQEIQARRF